MHRLSWYGFKYLKAYIPYGLALVLLLFILYAGWQLAHHPEAGADWSYYTGEIYRIDPGGPAAEILKAGDVILTVDGTAAERAYYLAGSQPGDDVRLLIERDGRRLPVILHLAWPQGSEVLERIVPLVVGLAYWMVGIAVLALSIQRRQALSFFAFCQGVTLTVVSGAISAIDPAWANPLFGILLWWVGILALRFHLRFPDNQPPHWERYAVWAMMLPAALGSVLTLIDFAETPEQRWQPLVVASHVWLALCLIGVVVLLIRGYGHAGGRQQVGVIGLGGGVALAGFAGLSILPQALLGVFVPYSLTFPLLLLIPLSYGYAILRYRLIPLDRYVDRAATYVLVLTLLGGLYSTTYAGFQLLLPEEAQLPAAGLGLALACAALAIPLYRWLRIGVDRLFYGGWYDYQTAVQQIGGTLDLALGAARLAERLAQRIQEVMKADFVYFFIPDNGELLAIGTGPAPDFTHNPGALHLPANDPLVRRLKAASRPVQTNDLIEKLGADRLSPPAHHFVHCSPAQLWLPLYPSGMLAVGAKRGGETFNAQDLAILETVAREAGIALQNAWLFGELEQQVTEGVHLHWQVLQAREDERKRVARELHDEIVQALAGLNLHLAQVRNRAPADLHGEISEVRSSVQKIIGNLRRVCADLRPPALDSFGLAAAVRARVREIDRQAPFAIRLSCDDDDLQALPERVSLCAYRFVQEALTNIQKHTAATQVNISIAITPDELRLVVEDNGRGFDVPVRLGQLVDKGHYGLVGLQERLEAVGGQMSIRSVLDHGTQLEAIIPLAQNSKPVPNSPASIEGEEPS